jgi:type IV pilus assembly protein PilV
MKTQRQQSGFLLIEALIAILIFSLGILGMVAMGGAAVGAQSDARFRNDAAALTDEIANRMAIDAPRSLLPVSGPDTVLAGSLATYQYQPITGAAPCAFSGVKSVLPTVTNWIDLVRADGAGAHRLPGATADTAQITVDSTAGFNQVSITICWQGPNDTAQRRHTLVTYIN